MLRNLYFYAGVGAFAWLMVPAESVVPFCLDLRRAYNRVCRSGDHTTAAGDEGARMLPGFGVAIAYPQRVQPVMATVAVDQVAFRMTTRMAEGIVLRTPYLAVEQWLDAVGDGQTCFLADTAPLYAADRASRVLHRMYEPDLGTRLAA